MEMHLEIARRTMRVQFILGSTLRTGGELQLELNIPILVISVSLQYILETKKEFQALLAKNRNSKSCTLTLSHALIIYNKVGKLLAEGPNGRPVPLNLIIVEILVIL